METQVNPRKYGMGVVLTAGEKATYQDSLTNMVNSLQDTWEANQKLIEDKIKDLESQVVKVEPEIEAFKAALIREADDLYKTIKMARKEQKEIKKLVLHVDKEDLNKIAKICELLNRED